MSESGNRPTRQAGERDVYTVSRLNRAARLLLEQGLARVWIEGELSSISRPSSGHLYFTLKDASAQVRGAMFKSRNQALRFRPEEGMLVQVRAKVSVYEPRGDYQLIAEYMEEAGDGVLQRAFEALKQKLDAEGLFADEHKLPLPAIPRRIGVITSPSGAAIRDVLSVLQRRFPALPVLVYPVPVQGKDAGKEIAAMIATASKRDECDVLILTRGGGSMEDLWAFNEEVVARAMHACHIPIVSAVGHEIDFTIADFVADQRAPTPSAAAELVSPDQAEWLAQVMTLEARLARHVDATLETQRQRFDWLSRRLALRHPGQLLQQQLQRLDELEQRTRLALRSYFNNLRATLQAVHGRLAQVTPAHRVRELGYASTALAARLGNGMQAILQDRRRRLAGSARALDAISPLATLDRGYAIVRRRKDAAVVRDASVITPGEQIETRLAKGSLVATVDEVHKKP